MSGYLRFDPYHVIIEVENRDCKILNILKSVGAEKFRFLDIRSYTGGITRHLVKLPREYIVKLPEYSLVKTGDKIKEAWVWIESEGCNVCNTILSHGAFLISGMGTENFKLTYSFIAPSYETFRSILTALDSSGFKLRILKVGKYKPRGKQLTERQEKILWLALKMGYFEYPKKINMLELSRKLGVKPSTLSEIIRRGVRRLLEHYFE